MTERESRAGVPAQAAPVGRPSKYKSEYVEQAYKLCLLGATDAQMADILGVAVDTLNEWKIVYPDFSASITRGKDMADAEMAESLYHRGKGYSHEAVKIFQNDGVPLIVPYIERYPPDTQAASLWLRNRQPARWRDKQDHEHTGKDGKDLMPPPADPSRIALELLSLFHAKDGESSNG